MRTNSFYIVYPEGDVQEINTQLEFDQLVGINGEPVRLPLASASSLIYRVYRINRKEEYGSMAHFHHLEQLNRAELESLAGGYGGW